MTTFGMTQLDLIAPSPTNPCKTFNEARPIELAAYRYTDF